MILITPCFNGPAAAEWLNVTLPKDVPVLFDPKSGEQYVLNRPLVLGNFIRAYGIFKGGNLAGASAKKAGKGKIVNM